MNYEVYGGFVLCVFLEKLYLLNFIIENMYING